MMSFLEYQISCSSDWNPAIQLQVCRGNLKHGLDRRTDTTFIFLLLVLDVTFASFVFLFQKKEYEKKRLVPDLISPASQQMHVCTSYTFTNTFMPRFSPSGLVGPFKCLVPTPGLRCDIRVHHVQRVCVCTYTRAHTYIDLIELTAKLLHYFLRSNKRKINQYTSQLSKNTELENIDKTLFFPHVQKS